VESYFFSHLLQFLLHYDTITINRILPDRCIVQANVRITQPHNLRHLVHRCYELLDLAHDPIVVLRIVPANAKKQIEEVAIACTQTQRIPDPVIANDRFLDDDLGYGWKLTLKLMLAMSLSGCAVVLTRSKISAKIAALLL
jgi:hypothetical protein